MYTLALNTPDNAEHRFDYEKVNDALVVANNAIKQGHLRAPKGITIITGPGTIYKVMSAEQQENAPKEDKPFVLIVQVAGGQLSPMGFDSEEAMDLVLQETLSEGVLRHAGRVDHEYTFVHTCPGTVLIPMTTEAFMEKQRRALAEHMRLQREAESKKSKSPIILPGHN